MQPNPTTGVASRLISYDGCGLQLYRWGQSGPACILLHGFAEGSYVWDDFAAAMAPKYRPIAVDLRGHGDSDWDVSHRYSSESYARDIVFLINELRLSQFAIIGHSLGGRIATYVAAACGDEVAALVLVDAAPELRRAGTARIRFEFTESRRTYAAIEEYADRLERQRPLVPRKTLLRFASRALRLRPDGAFELKADPNIIAESGRPDSDAGFWKAIAAVTCPTLLLRGVVSSVLSDDNAQTVAAAFARGELRTIDRAGHGLVAENPNEFADVALEFLDRAAIVRDR